jgi:HPt (histidine-containing phosphotransfer) domain-containing protein
MNHFLPSRHFLIFHLLLAGFAFSATPSNGSTFCQDPAAQATGTPQSPSGETKPPDAKQPKKTWTNDNLSDAKGAVSVVGDSKAGSKSKAHPAKPADAQYVASVRKQLEKLNTQMADADKQIADLTNFSKGESSTSASGIKLGKGYNREPIEVQIRALQEKKKDLQSKMDAVLDEARKKGVEPGQLR